jgi:hypothetical protein
VKYSDQTQKDTQDLSFALAMQKVFITWVKRLPWIKKKNGMQPEKESVSSESAGQASGLHVMDIAQEGPGP